MLCKNFFEQPTVTVAQNLIGTTLVYQGREIIITETEGYVGEDDPACHAAKGRTKRTEVMFGPAGITYVYLIYGMYHCLNIVTEAQDFPAAVLIRGGIDRHNPHLKLDGPGKLCRSLEITREDNQQSATDGTHLYFTKAQRVYDFESTPRIGIKVGTDKLWRFVMTREEQQSFYNPFNPEKASKALCRDVFRSTSGFG